MIRGLSLEDELLQDLSLRRSAQGQPAHCPPVLHLANGALARVTTKQDTRGMGSPMVIFNITLLYLSKGPVSEWTYSKD